MTKISGELRQWRNYFRSSKLDIFYIIESALKVAALDHPKEFQLRRDRISELLFSLGGSDSDKVEKVVPNVVDVEGDKGTRKCKNEFVRELKDCDVEKSKSESNDSYEEAEALNDEIEEESRVVNEVISIKKIIDNCQDESDLNICKSLKRLRVMALSVETLQNTEIGKSVHALRRHNSKNIQHLAKRMVKDWIGMVNEWIEAQAKLTERKPESTKASVVDGEDEGLLIPPLEDIPFLFTQTTSIELSQIFDGIDDDGNVISSVDVKDEQEKKQTSLVKPNKPPGGNSGRGRLTKPTLEQKLNNDHQMELSDKRKTQMRLVPTQQNKLKYPNEDAEHLKLESTKRKLQDHYQEAENAKRQRTIQVVKLQDIPKQGHGVRKPPMRPGNHNRPLVNRRQ